MRGPRRATWPPHPTLSPAVMPSLSIQSIAGERGQKLAVASFSDARSGFSGSKSIPLIGIGIAVLPDGP